MGLGIPARFYPLGRGASTVSGNGLFADKDWTIRLLSCSDVMGESNNDTVC
jgi:hypothetical protein